MKKLKMHTPDLTQDNIARIRDLFPNCVTEATNEHNQISLVIDFDQLRQELSGAIVEGAQERYQLNWPGKREALLTANAPIAKTLRPCRQESVNFDTTQNLFIEGDNLDALKLLQETYLGKVKMIYIDPPYNTGNDFIYEDDFAETTETFLKRSNQKDEAGNHLIANKESNGRFHSDWLSMIYPRLKLARNLLRDDGVIFISIDDNEQANLKRLCDEVFGEDNFIAQLIWNTDGHTDNQFDVKTNHEYVLLFAKNATLSSLGYVIDPNTRAESNLWKGYAENSITKNGPANPPSEIELPIGFPCLESEIELSSSIPSYDFFKEVGEHGYITRSMTERYEVSYPIRMDNINVKNGVLTEKCRVFSGWANANKLKTFIENKCKPIDEAGDKISFFLSGRGVVYYRREREKARNILSVLRNFGTTERMRSELELLGISFQYPKPKELINYLLRIGADKTGIILDFFGGSCTTAHAVMAVNAEDGGTRQYIMVQIPEVCDEKSEAFKAGYKTIAEIGKERIRRAGQKIKSDNPLTTQYLDIGFRVFKTDTSNMADVFYSPDAVDKNDLLSLVDNIKPDRTAEDLLFQLMLDWGVELALPIAKKTIHGKEVFLVDGNALVACFDAHGGVDEEFVKELAKIQPLRVVFRDAGFKDSAVKINVEQIFKLLSPEIDVKCI